MKREQVKIVEVGPRDGLQNEATELSVDDRVEFIRRLVETGLGFLEGGSFVSPKAISQMAESEKVWEQVKNENADISFLVPNEKGFERAAAAGVTSIAVFTATSSTFVSKNIGMTVDESLSSFEKICERARASKMRIRGYLSTAFGCPYEGNQSSDSVLKVTERLFSMGCDEISIGDTIGVAHPAQVKKVFSLLKDRFGLEKIAGHFHDTRGMALVNIQATLDLGCRIFDSSVGGLGGCPYATGSAGNVATEEVVYLMEGYGFETGVSLENLLKTAAWVESKIQRSLKAKFYLSNPKVLHYAS